MKKTLSAVVALVLGLMMLTVPAQAAAATNRGCPPPFTRATLAEGIALALLVHPELDPAVVVQIVTADFNKTNLNGDAYYCYQAVKSGYILIDNNVP
jgi:hypothetical protein